MIAALVLAALAFDPSAPATEPKRALALLVALLALSLAAFRAPRAGRPHAASLALLAALALSSISLLWGSSRGVLDLATWTAGVALALAVPSRVVAMQNARRAALWIGSGAAAFTIVEVLRGARGMFIAGGQGNANWLGLLLAVTIVLTADAARRSRTALLAVLPQALALGLSHARLAWIACLVATLIFASAHLRNARRGIVLALALLLFVFGAVFARGTAQRPAPRARVATARTYEAPIGVAWSGRVRIARVSVLAITPFGAGLGRFHEAFLDAQGARLAHVTPRAAATLFVNATTAHDEVLQLAVESGPLAALGLVVAFVGLVHGLRRWRAGAGAASAVAICMLGDDPLHKPAVVMMVALLFAALPRGRVRLSATKVTFVRALLVAACALFFAASVRAWGGARALVAAESITDPAAKLVRLGHATRIDPSSSAWFALGVARLESGHVEGAQVALEEARRLGSDVATDTALARVGLLAGRLDTAEAAARRALVRAPGSFRVRLALAEVLCRRGLFEEAEIEARIAHGLRPGDPAIAELETRIAEGRLVAAGG